MARSAAAATDRASLPRAVRVPEPTGATPGRRGRARLGGGRGRDRPEGPRPAPAGRAVAAAAGAARGRLGRVDAQGRARRHGPDDHDAAQARGGARAPDRPLRRRPRARARRQPRPGRRAARPRRRRPRSARAGITGPAARFRLQGTVTEVDEGASGADEGPRSGEVLVHVLDGELSFELAGERHVVAAGDTLHYPGDRPALWSQHRLRSRPRDLARGPRAAETRASASPAARCAPGARADGASSARRGPLPRPSCRHGREPVVHAGGAMHCPRAAQARNAAGDLGGRARPGGERVEARPGVRPPPHAGRRRGRRRAGRRRTGSARARGRRRAAASSSSRPARTRSADLRARRRPVEVELAQGIRARASGSGSAPRHTGPSTRSAQARPASRVPSPATGCPARSGGSDRAPHVQRARTATEASTSATMCAVQPQVRGPPVDGDDRPAARPGEHRVGALPQVDGHTATARLTRRPRYSPARSSSAATKQSSGAVATPAPTCPAPECAARMPVVTFGVIPSSTTARTSTPTGVPLNPSAGSVNRLLAPDADAAEDLGGAGGVGHRAAEERGDRRRVARRGPAEADELEHGAVADVRRGVVRAVARVVERLADRRRVRDVPAVRPGEPDPERRPVARHRRHDARALHLARPRGERAGRGHREGQEEQVVAAEEVGEAAGGSPRAAPRCAGARCGPGGWSRPGCACGGRRPSRCPGPPAPGCRAVRCAPGSRRRRGRRRRAAGAAGRSRRRCRGRTRGPRRAPG